MTKNTQKKNGVGTFLGVAAVAAAAGAVAALLSRKDVRKQVGKGLKDAKKAADETVGGVEKEYRRREAQVKKLVTRPGKKKTIKRTVAKK